MKNILLIATGGTIASKDNGNGLTPSIDVNVLLDYIPVIRQKCHVTGISLMNIDSSNMDTSHISSISECIMNNYNDYDGFVITHGTDTCAYTAAALSYQLINLSKPVILTGSQLPIDVEKTDAVMNLTNAFIYSCEDISGVFLAFSEKLIKGTCAKKIKTKSFDAFESMNFPELAIIRDNRIIRYYTEALPAPEDLITYDRLNDRVFVLKLTPEVKSEIFSLLFDHYDAIILETFGIGGIPAYDDSFEQAIFHWVDSGKTIAVSTQVPEEGCDLGVYQVGKKYSDHPGILQSDDMTTESIVAKLMWILGQTSEQDKISQLYYKEINHDRV